MLNPAHPEHIASNPPIHIYAPAVRRQRAIFDSVGGKLVECDTDDFRGGCVKTQIRRAVQRNPNPDKISKLPELGANQIPHSNSLPLVLDQQIMIGCERLDAFSETPDKVFRFTRSRLTGDCLHQTEHVLGAMISLMHQKLNVLDMGLQCLLSVACSLKSMGTGRLGMVDGGFVASSFTKLSGFPVMIRRTREVL
jgi:hypothetical protein